MYISLGNNFMIRKSDIISICDIDNSSTAKSTRAFLAKAEKSGRLINLAEDIPKSFVHCTDGMVYLSQISPKALEKRMEHALF